MSESGAAARRRRLRGVGNVEPPRRRALSRHVIVDAALRIIDAHGVDALTMRRVADDLQTGPASLYAHVADKDQLLELAFDRVLGEVPLPEKPDPRRWQEQLKQLARDLHEVLLRHRDIARQAMGQVPVGPNALAAYEATLAVLRAGKVDAATASLAADMIVAVVAGSAYEGNLWQQRGDGEDYAASLEEFFASLPPDRYPAITSMIPELVGTDDDGRERFEFKLDVLVAGIAARNRRR